MSSGLFGLIIGQSQITIRLPVPVAKKKAPFDTTRSEPKTRGDMFIGLDSLGTQIQGVGRTHERSKVLDDFLMPRTPLAVAMLSLSPFS